MPQFDEFPNKAILFTQISRFFKIKQAKEGIFINSVHAYMSAALIFTQNYKLINQFYKISNKKLQSKSLVGNAMFWIFHIYCHSIVFIFF